MSGQASTKWLQLVSIRFPFPLNSYGYTCTNILQALSNPCAPQVELSRMLSAPPSGLVSAAIGPLSFPKFQRGACHAGPAHFCMTLKAHKCLCLPSGASRSLHKEAFQTGKHKQYDNEGARLFGLREVEAPVADAILDQFSAAHLCVLR